MKPIVAKLLIAASDEMGLGLVSDEGYSGRGMYGSETVAVSGDSRDFLASVAYAAGMLETLLGAMESDEVTNLEEFVEAVSELRQDNLGRSQVWY